jgi:PTS system nitrogen regulatory IIA component
MDPVSRQLKMLVVGSAEELDMDSAGRILIPPMLRKYAKLDKDVVLVGQDKKFALWSEPAWQALFEQAAQLIQASHKVDAHDVFDSLFAREKLGSTALGYGIAIPHGRIKQLSETACAFARLKTPIEFDAPDNQPVDLVFMLLAPAAADDVHLQILGELAAMFSDADFRTRMRAAPDAASLHRMLTDWTP